MLKSWFRSSFLQDLAGAWVPAYRNTGSFVEDLSPYRQNAALLSMDPNTDWITRDGVPCLDFDNTNDQLTLGNLPHFSTAGDATVLAFLRTNAQASGTVNSYWASYNTSSPYQGFGLDCGGNAISTGQAIWDGSSWKDSSASTTAAATWQLVGASMRGTACTFYANGKAAGTTTLGTRGTWTGEKSIGPAPPPFASTFTGTLFNGQIGFVFLWQRTLQPTEITEFYTLTRQEFWLKRKKSAVVRGASVSTYTATASLVAGGAEFSGSATFTKPTYSGSASLTSGGAEFIGSATFDEPVYTASAALECGGALCSGNAEFDQPVYSGSAALTAGGAEFSGSGTTTQPTYSGSASLVAGGAEFAGSGTTAPPTYTGTASLTAGGAEISASAEFDQPVYSGSASLTCGGAEFSGSGVTTNTFTATGSFVVGGAEFAGSATFTPPTYTASGSFTTGGAEITASATFATNTYTATASLLAGGAEISASGAFTKPTYSGTASLVCGGAEFSGTSGTSSVFVPYYYLMMMGG